MAGEWLETSPLTAPKGYAPDEAMTNHGMDSGLALQLTSWGQRPATAKPRPCYQLLWGLVLQPLSPEA